MKHLVGFVVVFIVTKFERDQEQCNANLHKIIAGLMKAKKCVSLLSARKVIVTYFLITGLPYS